MINNKEYFHGSDLEKIEKHFKIKKEDITNFGANVNPLGISPLLKNTLYEKIDCITTYPDREYIALRTSISNYTNTPIKDIMVGNGSTELISSFIKTINPKKALLISPTYSEYKHEIELNGGICEDFILSEEENFKINIKNLKNHITNDIDLLIICNPNNPTSTAINNKTMSNILNHCKTTNTFIIIDETYIEFSENSNEFTSVKLTQSFDNLIVLRGVSKFFASPGLRLGYAICSNENIKTKLEKYKNPWSINTLASISGEIMFSDKEYINKTKNLILTEKRRIIDILNTFKNIKFYPCEANFILIKILRKDITSYDVFEACIKKGLMIRDCSDFKGLNDKFIRFCFLLPEKNTELLNELKNILE